MRVLISHIREEAALALKLKEWIEAVFAAQVDVFVSSDREDLPPGVNWLEELRDALESAQVLILLCSSASIIRPWINFEAGCAWIRRIPIIPVCHSGLRLSELQPPLSTFQALELSEVDFGKALVAALGNHLLLKAVVPKLKVDYKAMDSELLEAASSIPEPVASSSTPAPAGQGEISSEQVQILEFMSKQSSEGRIAEYFAVQFKVNSQKMKYHLGVLRERTLVDVVIRVGGTEPVNRMRHFPFGDYCTRSSFW